MGSARTEKVLRNRRKKQAFVNGIKTDSGCVVCSERDPRCLDFHHTGEFTKEMSISDLISRCASYDRIEKEIEKCVVLCRNCHAKVHVSV